MFEAVRLFGVTFPESDEEIQAAGGGRDPAGSPSSCAGARYRRPRARTDDHGRARAGRFIGLLVEAIGSDVQHATGVLALVIAKALSLSLQYGNCEESAFVYSCYAALLVSRYGNISWGCQFSEMALRLNE